MKKISCIYVAATSQHIGKTTSTLGLVQAIRNRGVNVGYSKPVGQEFVELGDMQVVDKDALLFSSVMGFELEAAVHSPVILGQGATSRYIDHPESFNYRERISYAAAVLEKRYEMMVYEGTGHPGVGSVVGLSNAVVAQMLNAGVIMVVKGGIGNTIDRLELSLALFRQYDVPVLGVIVNKVLPDKLEKVSLYLGKHLKKLHLNLLGVIPYDQNLANPLMSTVCRAVKGEVMLNGHNMENQVEEIVAGSLIDLTELKSFKNLLLVVSILRLEDAIGKLQSITEMVGLKTSPLSGILVTNNGDITPNCLSYIEKHEIPVVRTPLDTYGSVVQVSRIEVKINTRTPWKVARAVELIKSHVNLDLVLDEANRLR